MLEFDEFCPSLASSTSTRLRNAAFSVAKIRNKSNTAGGVAARSLSVILKSSGKKIISGHQYKVGYVAKKEFAL
ncbi:MAG: hypothetical protein D3924_10455 [Candidatus Electrothrix sp. AR4]|nr:hypothetical protein [Candidatus Electrothrix sp. AR4]